MLFCPTPTAWLSQASECASGWQAGLCFERAQLWSPGLAPLPILRKPLKVSDPQFLHLYSVNPNAYKGIV